MIFFRAKRSSSHLSRAPSSFRRFSTADSDESCGGGGGESSSPISRATNAGGLRGEQTGESNRRISEGSVGLRGASQESRLVDFPPEDTAAGGAAAAARGGFSGGLSGVLLLLPLLLLPLRFFPERRRLRELWRFMLRKKKMPDMQPTFFVCGFSAILLSRRDDDESISPLFYHPTPTEVRER